MRHDVMLGLASDKYLRDISAYEILLLLLLLLGKESAHDETEWAEH